MGSNKVKIVGYAKKEFFNDGIEYRNFSPDLVGNQTTSEIGTSVFTSGNFSITTNLDSKVDKRFVTNEFGDFMSLEDVNQDTAIDSIFLNKTKINLNLDNNDVLNYAFFGSLREYVRVSLENIIITWPASIYVRPYSEIDPSISGSTVLNYNYNTLTNISSFEVHTDRIVNNFDINYFQDGTIVDTFNESNDLRNLAINYASYIISNEHGDFPVVGFVGTSADTNTTMSFEVEGNSFPSVDNIFYHIKPNSIKSEEFFISLNDFEKNLLNRNSTPMYTAEFKVFSESDNGVVVESIENITWPVSDNYNIDFLTSNYELYVNKLISISDSNDSTKSNLITRFLVSKSVSEFDTIPDVDGTQDVGSAQKMTSALKVYGREFDEIKRYIDGISFANVVSYDKKNNTPDLTLKNLGRILGWDLTSSIEEVDLVTNYLKPNRSEYDGVEVGLTNAEADIELWRRIILNTPWIWKSKGTRKTIEFLFKFIGTPDGLVTFNEYVYVADKSLDVEVIKDMMEEFNNTRDISTLNVDENGFPRTLPDNPDMYFQKAGLWYRTTGGPTPDIDILYGNNPHIGPYDGGQAYIDQFSNCLIPNFVAIEESNELIEEGTDNLFTNFNNGDFGECTISGITGTTTSINITDENGMTVTNCFGLSTNIIEISGETCNNALEIVITEGVVDELVCNYTGTTLQTSGVTDGLVLLTYSGGSTSLNVHPECCTLIDSNYTPEIGTEGYYVCRWRALFDPLDCNNYTSTNTFDVDDFAIFTISTGGTTTIVPSAQCCYNTGLVDELTNEGVKCKEIVVPVCAEYAVEDNIPEIGDVEFTVLSTGLTTFEVPTLECCTVNGLSGRELSNSKWTCYKALNPPTVNITLDSSCCEEFSVTNMCFIGIFESDDIIHSQGGSVTYIDENNNEQVISGLFNDNCVCVDVKEVINTQGAHEIEVGDCHNKR